MVLLNTLQEERPLFQGQGGKQLEEGDLRGGEGEPGQALPPLAAL